MDRAVRLRIAPVFDGVMPPAPTENDPHPLSGETLPGVLGHEFSGVIEELREGVEGLNVRDSVVGDLPLDEATLIEPLAIAL